MEERELYKMYIPPITLTGGVDLSAEALRGQRATSGVYYDDAADGLYDRNGNRVDEDRAETLETDPQTRWGADAVTINGERRTIENVENITINGVSFGEGVVTEVGRMQTLTRDNRVYMFDPEESVCLFNPKDNTWTLYPNREAYEAAMAGEQVELTEEDKNELLALLD